MDDDGGNDDGASTLFYAMVSRLKMKTTTTMRDISLSTPRVSESVARKYCETS